MFLPIKHKLEVINEKTWKTTNNTGDYNKDDSKKRSLIRGSKPKRFLMYSFI